MLLSDGFLTKAGSCDLLILLGSVMLSLVFVVCGLNSTEVIHIWLKNCGTIQRVTLRAELMKCLPHCTGSIIRHRHRDMRCWTCSSSFIFSILCLLSFCDHWTSFLVKIFAEDYYIFIESIAKITQNLEFNRLWIRCVCRMILVWDKSFLFVHIWKEGCLTLWLIGWLITLNGTAVNLRFIIWDLIFTS